MKNLNLTSQFWLRFCFGLLVVFGFADIGYSQAFDYSWSVGTGSSSAEYANAVVTDNSGNTIVTGRFFGTVDFDPGSGVTNLVSAGNEDVFIAKYDMNGALIWAKSIGNSNSDLGFAIDTDNSDNVYVVGSFRLTVDFDPSGAGVFNMATYGNADAFLLKLDSDGNFVFAKAFQGIGTEQALAVDVASTGEIVCAGYVDADCDLDPNGTVSSIMSSGGLDMFVVKLDASANILWGYGFGATVTNDIFYDVNFNSNGDILLAGHFTGTIDFDPGVGTASLTSSGVEDIVILKLSAAGSQMWVRRIGATGTDSGRSIDVDASDNILIGGYFSSTVDLNPVAGIQTAISAGQADCFLVKLDNAGNFVWANAYGGTGNDFVLGSTIRQDGTIFQTGRYFNTVDFDPGTGTTNLTSNGSSDIFLSAFDDAGLWLYSKSFGGTGADLGFGVAGEGSDRVAIAGQFESTVDFDPNAGIVNATSVGLADIFVASYSNCPMPSAPSSVNGSFNICGGSTATYLASTVVGATSYTWTLPVGWTGSSTTNSIDVTCDNTSGTISAVANNACGSSLPTTFSINVFPVPTISGTDETFCEGSVGDLQVTADYGNVDWYDAPTGGTYLTAGLTYTLPALTADATYYVAGNNNGCITNPRFEIHAYVNPMPNVDVTFSSTTLTADQSAATNYQWVDCNNALAPISGETNQMFVLTTDGSYAVIVDLDGCVDTSTCTVINGLGLLSDNLSSRILVYPNPSFGLLTIEIPSDLSFDFLQIENALGQIIDEEKINSNSIMNLEMAAASGVYYVHLLNENQERVTYKIIKQ